MTSPAVAEGAAPWRTAWADALDTLELDLAQAEALLAARQPSAPVDERTSSHPLWTAPDLPGPLPGDLRDRARAILERQVRVSKSLVRAIAVTRREMELARRLDHDSADRDLPAFFDSQL